MKAIEIIPAEGGWMVRSDAIENDLFFRSGASAESAAIRLAQGLADAGEHSDVQIYLRDGSLARRFTVPSIKRLEALMMRDVA
ncbi:hypothetical protein LJR164_004507 [Phenylobacterium sp. LjRoot164]|uniref:hypothetical protein n=1 Tax=unclassified Phenylobacterium TaxID=2640670 RepID=UPI003ECF71CB